MTSEHRPVVVAVTADGSVAAVDAAVGEAVRRGCPVQVMHAVDLFGAPDHVLDRVVEQARALAGGRVHVTSLLHHGSALDGIIAASEQAQLLVIQRRATVPDHRRLRARLISGSLSPVLWVPDLRHAQAATGTVSVGVHDTLTCGPLIDTAFEVAAAHHARLRILHVRTEADDGLASRELASTLAAPGRRAHDGEVDVVVLTGRPGALLVEATSTSDLLVLGRHHPYRPGGSQLGPVARRVLVGASCPVLLPTPAQSVSSAAWVFASHLD
ncbi:hypothetical protein BH09ACT12_BH09ACT12_00810 [soil metagenome]